MLQEKYKGKVTQIHKIALNNLTKLLNEDPESLQYFKYTTSAKPLSADQRKVNNTAMIRELEQERDRTKYETFLTQWLKTATQMAESAQPNNSTAGHQPPMEHNKLTVTRKRKRKPTKSQALDKKYKRELRQVADTGLQEDEVMVDDKEYEKESTWTYDKSTMNFLNKPVQTNPPGKHLETKRTRGPRQHRGNKRKNRKHEGANDFQAQPAKKHAPSRAIQRQYEVLEILYERKVNIGGAKHRHAIRTHTTEAEKEAGVDPEKLTQLQVAVQWSHTYVPGNQLQQVLTHHEEMGYKPSIRFHKCTPRGRKGEILHLQNETEVLYEQQTPILLQKDGTRYTGKAWQSRCVHKFTKYSRYSNIYKIIWAPKLEPLETVRTAPGFQQAYARYQKRINAKQPVKLQVSQEQMRDIARQSGNTEKRLQDPLPPRIRNKLHFHHDEVKPGLDILPPGRYTLQQLKIPTKEGKQTIVYGCYSPKGQLIDTIATDRVDRLYSQFQRYAQEAKLTYNLEVGTFEEEIAKLLRRYSKTYKHNGRTKTNLKNHWANPPPIMKFIKNVIKAVIERFASPLNSTYDTYFSLYPQDAVFGAYIDAFAYQYGGTAENNTEYEPHYMDRDIRYSLMAAASEHEPYVAIHILPKWAATAYRKYEGKAGLHKLTTISREHFKFKTPDHWRGTQTYADTPNWDVNLYIVYNNSGLEQYWDEVNAIKEAAELATALGCKLEWSWPKTKTSNRHQLKPTRKYKSLPKLPPIREAIPQLHYKNDSTHPLLTFPGMNVYTDGSAIQREDGKQYIGAGMYDAHKNVSITINPAGKGPTNTITRAELAGILIAQMYTREHSCTTQTELHIFTDSKASMQQLQRMAQDPHTLRKHKHRHLLNKILKEATEIIEHHPIDIHIWKVRGHSNIHGNEMADKAAGTAAKQNMAGEQCEMEVDEHTDPYCDIHWAEYVHTEDDGTEQWRYVSDLNKHLRGEIRTHLGCGNCKEGQYSRAWDVITPDIYQAAMIAQWRRCNYATMRQVTKARAGHIYNKKHAVWFGKACDSSCPLCGEPDSTTHILSRCQALKSHHIERHNKAARMMIRAIAAGVKGRYLMWADVGKYSKLGKIATLKRKSLPEWLLPKRLRTRVQEHMDDDDKRKRLTDYNPKPDLVFMEKITEETLNTLEKMESTTKYNPELRKIQQASKIHILEFGYCSDTRWKAKFEEKTQQHRALAATMTELGWQVQVHAIVIGNTGMIPRNVYDTLLYLGVTKPQAQRCLADVATYSGNKVREIVAERRRLEQRAPG